MGKTSIEWTDESNNPIVAELRGARGHYCEKISPGCKNCYSSNFQPRFGMPQFQEQRNADLMVRLLPERLEQVLRRRKPTRFFWCDMSDLFGAWVSNEWIAACFGVMAATPHHTHQVLTKRAERLPEWFAWAAKRGQQGARLFPDDDLDWRIRQMIYVEARRAGVDLNADARQNHGGPWPLPNVHLGISAENQQTADERIPHLLRTPAAVRWVSAEPLLGPIDGSKFIRPKAIVDGYRQVQGNFPAAGPAPAHLAAPGIDWLVVGGESGNRARPCDVAWIRSIVDQCKAAGTPVFVKQVGANLKWDPDGEQWWRGPHIHANGAPRLSHRKGGDPAEWPEDLRVREMPRTNERTE